MNRRIILYAIASLFWAMLQPARSEEYRRISAKGIETRSNSPRLRNVSLTSLPSQPAPTAADVTETEEIQFTLTFKLIADALGPDPVTLYNFVRDKIEFDLYFGSLKGAEGCLLEGRGNDFDQASLLIALLRYHNIPARYEFGTLRLSVGQAQQLALTNIDISKHPYDAINESLSSLGIPAEMIIDAENNPLWMVVDQCWVRAYVPVTNWRGRPGGESTYDWVPLYPALKNHEYDVPSTSLAGRVDFAPDDFFQNAALNQTPLDYYTGKLLQYVSDNSYDCPTLASTFVSRRIHEQRLEVLPGVLPAQIQTGGSYQPPVSWSEIPDDFRHKVSMKATYHDIYDEKWTSFQTQYTTVESYGKKIGITWEGASKADQEAISAVGNLYRLPKGVQVNVRATVSRDDEETLATGDSLPAGTSLKLELQQVYPNYPSAGSPPVGQRTPEVVTALKNDYDLSAGGACALALATLRVPEDVFGKHVDRLETLRQSGASQQTIRSQELYIRGLDFFRQLETSTKTIAGIHRYNFNRIWYLVQMVDDVSENGFSQEGEPEATRVDFHAVISPFPINGDTSLDFEVVEMAGHQGSSHEFTIIAQYANQESVSYVNLMQRSVQQANGYLLIDNSNVDTFSSQLTDIPAFVIDRIDSHIRRNPTDNIARVPYRQVQVNRWRGIGYLLGDKVEGTGDYLIHGGIAP